MRMLLWQAAKSIISENHVVLERAAKTKLILLNFLTIDPPNLVLVEQRI